MPTFHYLQLDVFPATPGGGNPLGVVVDARGWSGSEMQRFAAWTNLVETTFLLPPENDAANYRLRIFTPTQEIPFAGHPSIGSAHAALNTGFAAARDGTLIQQCGAGLLPIRVEGKSESRELLIQAPSAKKVADSAASRTALNAALGDRRMGGLPPALIEGGRRWWVAEFADEESVRSWQPDHAAIGALAKLDNCMGLCVFARCANADYQLVVRAFPAGVGIVEDPASGAANGLIATWIAMCEPGGTLARGFRVSQGREMGHDASITLRIDAGGEVWVGGRTQTIADRILTWN
ncbi:MAG TPA: PhzF family phenazine biosynthesis protein [Rudaea sp.]|jgi:PhzF family phenazine biosynthesis protein|nr:PhzF family phenazine biosynthesis protein [Rudaea sp.]